MTSNNPTAQAFADQMKKMREEIGAALKKAGEDMKQHYDKGRKKSEEYRKGDKVWLEATNITTEHLSKKLDNKRFGPFKVIEKIGASSYKLAIPKTWKSIHPVFNKVLLSRYHEPNFPSQPRNTNPPPEVVIGKEPKYKVEEIVDSRMMRGRKILYKVKWKGYGAHEMTWEPASNLENAREAV